MDCSSLMFTKENLKEKTAKLAIIAAFIFGLIGHWFYKTFDVDPTFILPLIACIPAWKAVEKEPVKSLLDVILAYAFVTFIYTGALCIPAGIGLALTDFLS